MVTNEQIETYATDGVVCLRGVIDDSWIASLRSGLDKNLAAPTDRGRVWHQTGDGKSMFYDSQAWRVVDEYRDFIVDSPMAEIAGRLMGSESVNFFFDAIFSRAPGTQFRTPFHQDEPYWSVSGFDCVSGWMPLTSVAESSALEFVRGSHLWNERYVQQNFGALTGDVRDQVAYDDPAALAPFPDIEAKRDVFDVVSWDMEPGDVAMFNARTIHGGSGRLDADKDLQVFNTKWLGDDVRVCFRSEGMDPDHSQVMTDHGLAPGDRVSGDLYPELWRRDASGA